MARAGNQKGKLLCLMELLLRETDAEHPMPLPEIQARLAEMGVRAERKSLYDDIRTLNEHGVVVEFQPKRGYAVVSRTYELAELKMLVDIISSANFLTEKKSRKLIRKLYGETSRYGVLLVYRKKAVGAYLLEKPSGTVIGLKDAQTAMAQAEQQDAQQVSGEDYSGDWGERHDEELGAAGQSQQTSGEPDSVVPEEAQYTDLPLDAEGYPVE